MCKPRPTGFRLVQRTLTLLALLASLHSTWGAPFSKQIDFVQPDGSQIQLWGKGDEFYAVFETLDGYTVVFDQSLKAYCYAKLSDDATQLLSTGTRVQSATGQALGLPQHLRIAPDTIRQEVSQRRAQWETAMEVEERWNALKAAANATPSGAAYAPPGSPTVGTKVGLTLLIDFDDDQATIPQADIDNFCNGDNYKGFSNNGSVKKYFSENSNGKLTYSNVVTIYIRAPQPKTYYNDTGADAGLQARKLITDALGVMKALPNYDTEILPLFANLTTDSQNRAVAFNVFYAGGNGGVWSMGLWPHSWALSSPVELSPGGKKVFKYQITDISSKLTIGTFCHENGHMLCGFPDIYDYDYDSAGGAGFFCLMNSGSYGNGGLNPVQVCAYLKRAAGWATTIDLDSSSSLVASSSCLPGTNFNVFYRYQKPGVSTEYYLLECRYTTNRDADLPASGMAVWHIDEKGDRDNQSLKPNTSHANYEVTLVQADNRWDFEKNRNDGDAADLYFLGNKTAGYSNILSDVSAPNSKWWDGTSSGLVLRNFAAPGPTMTFIVGTNDPAPAIATQPQSQTVVAGMPAAFSVSASGLPPLAYQWAKDGTSLTGATKSSYSIDKTKPSDAGSYSVTVSNQYGVVTSATASLVIIPTLPLPYALNNSNLTWTTDPLYFWYGQTNRSHDGIASARSVPLPNGQQTAFRASVTGPGTLTFWWRVSSQPDADYLSFRYGSIELARLTGEVEWRQETVYLPAGTQALEWTYSKDASTSEGDDSGWVDEVSYVSGATPPYIITQPYSQSSLGGSPVSFKVVANGTPELSYQWLFNGNALPGATASTLLLPRPQNSDSGVYSVRVTSPYGSILSSDAILGVVPMAVSGDNSFGQANVSAQATNAIAIAAGGWHALSLTSVGTVLAWGNNSDGQCNVPANLRNAAIIAAGGYHSLAVKADRTVIAWGAGFHGQATPPVGLSNVIAIAAGTWHSIALRSDGTVAAWGDNSWGQTDVPAGLANVVAIAAGGNHNLALKNDGTVIAWGENTDAQGLYAGQSDVPWGLSGVVGISAGQYHSLAIKSDGTVTAWGDNSEGQAQPPSGLTGVVAVAAGGSHSLALKSDGTVSSWGANWNGQCSFPLGLPDVLAIAAGNANSVLLVGQPSIAPSLLLPTRSARVFTAVIQTAAGKHYSLEYADSMTTGAWNSLPPIFGNGSLQFVIDPQASVPQRFYRVRQW